jgi:polysaccharide export outer membrane protein
MVLLLVALGLSASGQQQSSRTASSSFEENMNLPLQRIGVDDLLGITVYDGPELTRTVRVNADGMIHLPILKPGIKVDGLFPAEVEAAIVAALQKEDVFIDPIVTVSVVEYQSRPINVAGAVKVPTTFQASGALTLLEALGRAGGLSEFAGPEILVGGPQPGPDGQTIRVTQRILVQQLLDGFNSALNIRLKGGEEILVPEAGKIYVVGSIRKPGTYPIRDALQLSVMKALALSEGLTPFALSTAYIYRQEGANRREIPVRLGRILQRKSPDVALLSNDILYIPDSKGRRGLSAALDKALLLGGGLGAAAIYAAH